MRPASSTSLSQRYSISNDPCDVPGALRLLDQAAEQRPAVRGTVDGQPFSGLRDLDDLNASFMEVLTSTGKYYWKDKIYLSEEPSPTPKK